MAAESAGQGKVEALLPYPCPPRYICSDLESGCIVILDARHELVLSIVMADGLDAFEIAHGERSIRFGSGCVDGFHAGDLSLLSSREAEILGPGGRHRLLLESDSIRLVLPGGDALVRYVKNFQFRLLSGGAVTREEPQGLRFETSYPTPTVEGRQARKSGIIMGGPVNSIVSPGFWDQVASGDAFVPSGATLSALTMSAAATVAFALCPDGRAQGSVARRPAVQALSTALSDGAVMVAILRSFAEVRRFLSLSRTGYEDGVVRIASAGSRVTS